MERVSVERDGGRGVKEGQRRMGGASREEQRRGASCTGRGREVQAQEGGPSRGGRRKKREAQVEEGGAS